MGYEPRPFASPMSGEIRVVPSGTGSSTPSKPPGKPLGEAVWEAILPGFEEVILGTYREAVGIDEVPPELLRRERRKFELLCREDLGPEFAGLLDQVVTDNIAAGLTHETYLAGYGVYAGYLAVALRRGCAPDEPRLAEMLRFLLRLTHVESSQAIGRFFTTQRRESREARDRLAAEFEAEVLAKLRDVDEAIQVVQSAARELAASSASAASHVSSDRQRADQLSAQVASTAESAGQLSDAARELAEQVASSAATAGAARRDAEGAAHIVTGLRDNSRRIQDVIGLIRNIADQTRMLALNATIEAARAGAAGKGFGVVATEVKSLAKGTAEATEGIAAGVESIDRASRETEAAVESLTQAIEQIDQLSSAIAAVGEEQSAATREIAGIAEDSARAASEIRTAVDRMAAFAQTTAGTGQRVEEQVNALVNARQRLRESLTVFVAKIREP